MTSSPIKIKEVNNVLFVHPFLAMGDAILLSPVYKTIKDNVSGVEISVLTNTYSSHFIKAIPSVDRIYILDSVFGKSKSRIVHFLRLCYFLLKNHFDTIVLRGDRRLPQRAFNMASKLCRLNTVLLGDYLESEVNKDRHIVESYLIILEKMGFQVKDRDHLHIKISDNALAEAKKLLKGGSKNYAGVAPVSNVPVKNWSAEKTADLIKQLKKEGYEIILFCGDRKFSDTVRGLVNNDSMMIIDKLDFPLLTALISLCNIFIGVDTGLTHLAAAVNIATVGLYGPTSGAIAGPYNKSSTFVQTDVECGYYKPLSLFSPGEEIQECYRDGMCRLPMTNCVEKIEVDSVLEAVGNIMGKMDKGAKRTERK